MWLISLRDLQWRRRRFAIAVAATALVFALALLLSGVSASFDNEAERTVSSFGADRFLVARGSFGPFTGPTAFPAGTVDAVRRLPGVTAADPVAVLRATTTTPSERNLELIGAVPGGVGPASTAGGLLRRSRDALVDASLGLGAGDALTLNGVRFRVVGVTHGHTYFAGVPTVVVSLADAQQLGLDGRPLATAIVTRGVPRSLPPTLSLLDRHEVLADLGRPVAQAKQTIDLIRWLLWAVAAAIIGAIVYLSALERTADFAVLKAIGVSTRTVVMGLVAQSTLLAALAVSLSVVLEILMAPASAMSVEVPPSAYLLLPVVALVIGVAASMVALRRALRVDPALAFAG